MKDNVKRPVVYTAARQLCRWRKPRVVAYNSATPDPSTSGFRFARSPTSCADLRAGQCRRRGNRRRQIHWWKLLLHRKLPRRRRCTLADDTTWTWPRSLTLTLSSLVPRSTPPRARASTSTIALKLTLIGCRHVRKIDEVLKFAPLQRAASVSIKMCEKSVELFCVDNKSFIYSIKKVKFSVIRYK